MKCSHCASEMPDDSRFCPQCGLPRIFADETASGTRRFASPGEIGHPRAAVKTDSSANASESAELLDNDTIHALLTRANLSRLRGNWADATDRCVTVLRAQPGNATAHSLLGDIYRDQGKLDDAIQWYRMAVDLRPNPSDEAKLRQQERERAKLITGSGGQDVRGGRRVPLSLLGLDSSVLTGTANLLGMSPRRWLRGITIVSVAFLAVMILILLAMQGSRRNVAQVPHPTAMPSAISANGTQSLLPPPDLQGARRPAGATFEEPPVNAAGSGFPADAPNSAAPAPSSKQHTRRDTGKEEAGVPVAPVKEVVPLGGETSSSVYSWEGNSDRLAQANTPLEGGMQVVQVQKDLANSSAAITILSPYAQGGRSALVRNAYRAARAVFAGDTGLARVSILIQPDSAANAAPLLYAELDRFAAEQLNPNTDSLEKLASYLRILSLPGQDAEPAPAQDGSENDTSSNLMITH